MTEEEIRAKMAKAEAIGSRFDATIQAVELLNVKAAGITDEWTRVLNRWWSPRWIFVSPEYKRATRILVCAARHLLNVSGGYSKELRGLR